MLCPDSARSICFIHASLWSSSRLWLRSRAVAEGLRAQQGDDLEVTGSPVCQHGREREAVTGVKLAEDLLAPGDESVVELGELGDEVARGGVECTGHPLLVGLAHPLGR